MEPGIFNLIKADMSLEEGLLEPLSESGNLAGFKHHGFWQCMDTMKDKKVLNEIWNCIPKWKRWGAKSDANSVFIET